MKKLLLLALTVACAAPAAQVCAGVSTITSMTSCSLGNLTFSNFGVDQAIAPVLLMDAAKDPAGHNGEIVLDLNPQLWSLPGASPSYWFTFQVAGGVQGINLSVGGANATITERACSSSINSAGGYVCSGSGTELGLLTGSSGQNTQNVKFNSSTPIYVATNVKLGNAIQTSELTSMSLSFEYGNGSGTGGGGEIPEPDSALLLGSGLTIAALLLRKRIKRVG